MNLHNNDRKLLKDLNELRRYCKFGHSVCIGSKRRKIICSYCGSWIYKNDKDEFKDKLMMKIERRKLDGI